MNLVPTIIQGKVASDDRGSVRFVNEFNFSGIKRFYQVQNAQIGQVRAFHGHMKEEKFVYVTSGRIMLCAVRLTDAINPSKAEKIYRFDLDVDNPCVVHIPAGYANGFKSLTSDAKVIFYSNASVEQSMADDYRFSSDYFGDIW